MEKGCVNSLIGVKFDLTHVLQVVEYMTSNQSLSGMELEVAFGQLYMNATFQVPLPKILCFDYDCQTQTDTFFVIDNSHCFNHIPTEANPKQIYSRRRW